ncbi:LuxR C-terminal-related transcriptional regulator [Altererythrobacter sp. ZODW24]|uniref:LuxR C-terminal-related transcriptional regulator n=1 Tax=Altererythrobacter sp. ZODW24 TaxID=2185142 RepID=UPI000DF7D360
MQLVATIQARSGENAVESHWLTSSKPAEWVMNLIEASPVASVISDPRLPDNPIVAVNEAFMKLTGYDANEILGRNCRFLSGEGTEPWLTDRIRDGVRLHKPVLVEILNYKKGSIPFRNAVLVAPIYDDRDDLLYFLGSQVEIDDNHPETRSAARERASAQIQMLSPRQFEVTRMVAAGLRNKQIAGDLGISEKTVKMHRGLAMEKLEIKTTADLVRVAVEAGI